MVVQEATLVRLRRRPPSRGCTPRACGNTPSVPRAAVLVPVRGIINIRYCYEARCGERTSSSSGSTASAAFCLPLPFDTGRPLEVERPLEGGRATVAVDVAVAVPLPLPRPLPLVAPRPRPRAGRGGAFGGDDSPSS